MSNWIRIGIILITCTAFCSCADKNTPTQDADRLLQYRRHIVAHRGLWQETGFGENTFQAVKAAAETGIWGAEIDIRETADGRFILNHDAVFFGCTIATSTLEQLQTVGAHQGKDITLLEDILALLKEYPRFHIQIEVKAGRAEKISTLIASAGVSEQVVIISFSREICFDFIRCSRLPVVLLCHTKHDFDAKQLKTEGFYGVSMHFSTCLYDDTARRKCSQNGLTFTVWTPNNPNEIAKLLNCGVDFVVTDIAQNITYKLLKESL